MAITDARRAAYEKLDEAVNALVDVMNNESEDCDDDTLLIPTDYVLLVGLQGVDDDGDRVDGVNFFPKGGSQPGYITRGLVATTSDWLASTL
ncbi:DUF7213 family protein [Mycobacteroides abscessus]|uniref:DUF7213 family protein n=1 Tax=Mycobacteroides abscessus TaxID=36809 RepID=UPI00092A471B|nr:hypothetical protein [Mycobacteroides abscessus]SIC88120.1 Uncharacterised protein [Mycobacteroides abscessus subsp. bolletii]SKT76024.1 Uncharacterised protein [Mycobacteroides abscessus subsp. bolletii]SLD34587.1 Uncharacterised protein [Mycobacteroides abscessus subsp. bolletii]SLF80092.1 Uncharacterised protein [Mycobacteroides abscessus subsp. bolletii]